MWLGAPVFVGVGVALGCVLADPTGLLEGVGGRGFKVFVGVVCVAVRSG